MTLFRVTARRAARSVLFRAFDADRLLARAARRGDRRFAFAWVRGVGDVAFVLNEFTRYVQRRVTGAEVTALVRPGLEAACRWIPELHAVIPVEEWSRERTQASLWDLAYPPPWEIRRALAQRGLAQAFDGILPYPLGRWYDRDLRQRRPWLRWSEAERRFGVEYLGALVPPGSFVITMNVTTGTARYYEHVKDWGLPNFGCLMTMIVEAIPESRLVLVDGARTGDVPAHDRIIDLRGELGLAQCISVIAASDLFVGLDTGPANLVYFMEDVTARLVVLLGKTDVFTPLQHPPASPGVQLTVLVGKAEDITQISADSVLDLILAAHAAGRDKGR